MEEKFSIQPYLNDAEILNQTAQQIIKELAVFQIDIVLLSTSQNAYTQLFEQIFPHIKELAKNNYQKLLSLLYRIDISEIQLRNELRKNEEQSQEEVITHLIIKRCLQKVVLRKLFS